MAKMIIDGIDFHELEVQKYWAPPSTWSDEKRRTEVQNRIFSGKWWGARKMDGAFYRLTKSDTGEMELIGRSKGVNGDYLNKIEWVPQLHDFFNELPNGTCLLGELVFPENEGSKNTTTIMGCLKEKAISRQETGSKLHYYIFDILANQGESWLNKEAEDRFDALNTYSKVYPHEYVDFASYYYGEDLWNQLQDILASGGEGMVIVKNDSVYEPGKRPSKTTMKIKKELTETIDCIITGANSPTKQYTGKDIENWDLWVDTVTGEKKRGNFYRDYYLGATIEPVTKTYFNGWAGSFRLGLYKDGELIHFGDLSGITDEMKENWQDYVGRVVKVGGMEIFGDTGAIRHPKLIELRPIGDKDPKDCTWDQIK